MPILATIASSTRQGLSTSAFESIATFTITSNTNSVEFTSIPNSYKHLVIRASCLSDSYAYTTLNGDTGNNYSDHVWTTDGASILEVGGQGANGGGAGFYGRNRGGDTQVPFNVVWDILDYTNTSKVKVIKMWFGAPVTSGNYNSDLTLRQNLWNNTSAVTSIKIQQGSTSANFFAGTKIALYGIKG